MTPEERTESRRICEAAASGRYCDVHSADIHARTAFPAALNDVDALCEMLGRQWQEDARNVGLVAPDWVGMALAMKDARKGRGQTIDDVLEALEAAERAKEA